jgi:hypothetical protein
MRNDWIAYHDLSAKLELQPQPTLDIASDSCITALSRTLTNWGKTIAKAVMSQSEPQICRMIDCQGNISWYVYDPITRTHGYFESEDDVRVWFEKRYTYTPKPAFEATKLW